MGVCVRPRGCVHMCKSVHACRCAVWRVCTRVPMSALSWLRSQPREWVCILSRGLGMCA